MKPYFLSAAILFSAIAPCAAQDLAALAPLTPLSAHAAGEDIPTTSVMPLKNINAVVKAARSLRAGTVLHASDLAVESGNPDALSLLVGMELKRAVYAGANITPGLVGPPTAVERNAIVTLEFSRGPLMISTEARALDAGAVGESVRVMNLNSKTILSAVITGPNKAVTK